MIDNLWSIHESGSWWPALFVAAVIVFLGSCALVAFSFRRPSPPASTAKRALALLLTSGTLFLSGQAGAAFATYRTLVDVTSPDLQKREFDEASREARLALKYRNLAALEVVSLSLWACLAPLAGASLLLGLALSRTFPSDSAAQPPGSDGRAQPVGDR